MKRTTQLFSGGAVEEQRWPSQHPHWTLSAVAVALSGALYWCIVAVAGGFNRADADTTIYSSVMYAHGYWTCAYRSVPSDYPLAGPVYPVVSGLVQWITRAGFSSSKLLAGQFGANCQHAYSSYWHFEGVSNIAAYQWVLRTGVVAFVALAVSALAIFRSTPWHSTRITWLVPLALALTPPVVFCVQEDYHPQDIWALSMAFAAVALGLRGRSLGAGVVWALAVMSQPYTLLGVVVILVVSPRLEQRRLIVGGALGALVLGGAFYLVSGPRALSAALLGTGHTSIHEGTWMAQLHVGTGLGLVISRIGPLVGAALVAWWVRTRRPDVAHDPIVLLGLLATAWSLRLVFEENLWGYYCMATGATLVLRDIMVRRTSRGTIYWLVMVFVAFGRVSGYPRPWGVWPYWVWQLLLVPSAFLVAFFSLRASMKSPPSASQPLRTTT